MNNGKSKNVVAVNTCSNEEILRDFLLKIANKMQPANYVFEIMIGKRIDCSIMFYNKVVLEKPYVEYRIYNGNYTFLFKDSNGSIVTIPTFSNVLLKMLDDKTHTTIQEEIAYIDFVVNYFGNDVDVKIGVEKKIE